MPPLPIVIVPSPSCAHRAAFRPNASITSSISPVIGAVIDDGKPFDIVKRAWGKLLRDAGIIMFRWHDMRHDFASRLVMAGAPLNTVRELLGQTSAATTLRYAHLAPDHKAQAVEELCGGSVGVDELRPLQDTWA